MNWRPHTQAPDSTDCSNPKCLRKFNAAKAAAKKPNGKK